MVHALRRILYCTSDSKKHLFAIVSMDLQDEMEQVYTHVFITAKKEQVSLDNHTNLVPPPYCPLPLHVPSSSNFLLCFTFFCTNPSPIIPSHALPLPLGKGWSSLASRST